jgi:transposase InsO family protein
VKFAFIKENRTEFPVGLMCRLLSVSKSGFYKWFSKGGYEVSPTKLKLQEEVRRIFTKHRKRYGSPRVYRELKSEGIAVGKGTIEKIMRDLNLKAKGKRRFVSTTDSNHSKPIAPNLLDRQFNETKVDAVWLSDISYLPLREVVTT